LEETDNIEDEPLPHFDEFLILDFESYDVSSERLNGWNMM